MLSASASADNTLLDLHHSSYHTQPQVRIAKEERIYGIMVEKERAHLGTELRERQRLQPGRELLEKKKKKLVEGPILQVERK